MPTPVHPEEPICIFVFPPSLTFYADDPTSHKQILSIHNPYGFHLKFKVLSTDTSKYTVSEAQGYIKPLNAQDLVVRHKAISSSNFGVSDTIRVQLFSSGQSRPLGIKEITVTLQASRPEPQSAAFSAAAAADAERFQQLNTDAALSGYSRQRPIITQEERSVSSLIKIIICVTLAILCFVVLNLPSKDDTNVHLPEYFHLSEHVRLIAAYILGCVTCLFLRT